MDFYTFTYPYINANRYLDICLLCAHIFMHNIFHLSSYLHIHIFRHFYPLAFGLPATVPILVIGFWFLVIGYRFWVNVTTILGPKHVLGGSWGGPGGGLGGTWGGLGRSWGGLGGPEPIWDKNVPPGPPFRAPKSSKIDKKSMPRCMKILHQFSDRFCIDF